MQGLCFNAVNGGVKLHRGKLPGHASICMQCQLNIWIIDIGIHLEQLLGKKELELHLFKKYLDFYAPRAGNSRSQRERW